ncbi:hypothetical protein RHMOL_Rhmol11G0207900 [Rhododendron molle]|uniref:Uncharacterized protein n=1 Tax=Rhododendron molle TaxID=49168 RepID=A0ACC0LUM9_RHOML|nr:hypothetical protein RHMOL_Rhmol11G0207900 [Rhododendron molle]
MGMARNGGTTGTERRGSWRAPFASWMLDNEKVMNKAMMNVLKEAIRLEIHGLKEWLNPSFLMALSELPMRTQLSLTSDFVAHVEWSIWKSRNAFKVFNSTLNPISRLKFALKEKVDFLSAGYSILKVAGAKSSGFRKFNYDGAFNWASKIAAIGVIVRNSHGGILEVNYGRINLVTMEFSQELDVKLCLDLKLVRRFGGRKMHSKAK